MKKVVSATLAGALAVGMVPAMALADEIPLQASDEADLVAKGDIVLKGGVSGAEFTRAGDKTGYLVPEAVAPFGADDEEDYVTAGVTFEYWMLADAPGTDTYIAKGALLDGKRVYVKQGTLGDKTGVGTHVILALYNGEYIANVATYTVKALPLSDVDPYEFNDEALDDGKSDSEFTYKAGAFTFGTTGDIRLVADGEDVTAQFENFKVIDLSTNKAPASTWYAGKYKLTATGIGDYAGETLEIKIDVDPFVIAEDAKLESTIVAISDEPALDSDLAGLPISIAGYKDEAALGENAAVVVANEGLSALEDASIDERGELPFTFVQQVLDDDDIVVTYGGASGLAMEIDYSDPAKDDAFNKALVKVTIPQPYIQDPSAVKTLTADEYSLSVTKINADGSKTYGLSESALQNPGTYDVAVVLDAKKLDYLYGGTDETYRITVTNGAVAAADVAFVFDGKASDGETVDYTGADYLDKLAITLWDGNNKKIDAADYAVTVKKTHGGSGVDTKDAVVDEIVDAGTYVVTVTSEKYVIEGGYESITIVVNPVDIAKVALDADLTVNAKSGKAYPAVFFAGKEIAPVFQYKAKDANGADILVDVPADAYTMKIVEYKDMDEKEQKVPAKVETAGWYKVEFADASPLDNYDVADMAVTPAWFCVTDESVFIDVASDAWYAPYVYDIARAQIMGGYGNGKFGPNDDAERQDVALMMFRMLTGNQLAYDAEDWWAEAEAFGDVVLPFADTDNDAYYAWAVWYCNKNGIMTGYSDGSNEFGVGDAVTREQVATILFRSKDFGTDTLLASGLDAYADSDEISKFAVEAMEWAVEEGIFGVNTKYLNPGESITRAELAAVFARYMDANDWTVPDGVLFY